MVSSPSPPSILSFPSPPLSVSEPSPPISSSFPSPPISSSFPSPPISSSFPAPPARLSPSFPPISLSFPSPPPRSSPPFPPSSKSLPLFPRIVSSPPNPNNSSFPSWPLMSSFPEPPITQSLPPLAFIKSPKLPARMRSASSVPSSEVLGFSLLSIKLYFPWFAFSNSWEIVRSSQNNWFSRSTWIVIVIDSVVTEPCESIIVELITCTPSDKLEIVNDSPVPIKPALSENHCILDDKIPSSSSVAEPVKSTDSPIRKTALSKGDKIEINGASFVLVTVTVTVAVSVPPLPSEIV